MKRAIDAVDGDADGPRERIVLNIASPSPSPSAAVLPPNNVDQSNISSNFNNSVNVVSSYPSSDAFQSFPHGHASDSSSPPQEVPFSPPSRLFFLSLSF